MALDNYYEPFYIQSQNWQDDTQIMGFYKQNSSGELRRADATGTASGGTFITQMNVTLEPGVVLRRESDGIYIKIIGAPVSSPCPATSKFHTMNAEVTQKP